MLDYLAERACRARARSACGRARSRVRAALRRRRGRGAGAVAARSPSAPIPTCTRSRARCWRACSRGACALHARRRRAVELRPRPAASRARCSTSARPGGAPRSTAPSTACATRYGHGVLVSGRALAPEWARSPRTARLRAAHALADEVRRRRGRGDADCLRPAARCARRLAAARHAPRPRRWSSARSTLGYARAGARRPRQPLPRDRASTRRRARHGLRPLRRRRAAGRAGGRRAHAARCCCALDRRGYANLCRLLTARHLDADFDLGRALGARARRAARDRRVAALAAALLAAGVPAAALGARAAPGTPRAGRAVAGRARTRGAAPRAWPSARGRAPARRAAGRDRRRGDARARRRDAHRAAATAAAGGLLERMPAVGLRARARRGSPRPAEWARRVRAACAAAPARPRPPARRSPNNAALAAAAGSSSSSACRSSRARRCRRARPAPRLAAAPGRGRARAALPRRRPAAPRGAARLAQELEMIERLGFTDYFLLVADIVGFARGRGHPERGARLGRRLDRHLRARHHERGSAALRPVLRALPAPERRDCPDLDIDLCWSRRDEVIAHVYRTYGAERVAMISTHATLGPRSAFREAAKALGVPNAARRTPGALRARASCAAPCARAARARCPRRAASTGASRRWPERAARWPNALRRRAAPPVACTAAGSSIADRPLTDYMPLEAATKGIVVTQFEMRADRGASGLVKMDLLGNRALTTIGECVDAGERGTGGRVEPRRRSAARRRPGDRGACSPPATRWAASSSSRPAMRNLLRMLDARDLDDTIAAVALVRPGAGGQPGMKEALLRRQRGLEPVTFRHPRLEPVLGATARRAAVRGGRDARRRRAGRPLAGRGRRLAPRASAAARGDEEFRGARALVRRARARARGVTPDEARARVARAGALRRLRVLQGARRGLRRAGAGRRVPHDALPGRVGGRRSSTTTPACTRCGCTSRTCGATACGSCAPCVDRSAWATTLEAPAVRVGLGRVVRAWPARPASASWPSAPAARSAASPTSSSACAPRRPSWSRSCWPARSTPPGARRPSLLLEARVSAAARGRPASRRSSRPTAPTSRPPRSPPVAAPDLPEFDAAERVRGEWSATGLWFSGHPLDGIVDPGERGLVPAAGAGRHAGRRIAVAGLSVRATAGRDPRGEQHAVPHARRPQRPRRVRPAPRRVPRPRARHARHRVARRGPRRGDARRGHAPRRARRRARLNRDPVVQNAWPSPPGHPPRWVAPRDDYPLTDARRGTTLISDATGQRDRGVNPPRA